MISDRFLEILEGIFMISWFSRDFRIDLNRIFQNSCWESFLKNINVKFTNFIKFSYFNGFLLFYSIFLFFFPIFSLSLSFFLFLFLLFLYFLLHPSFFPFPPFFFFVSGGGGGWLGCPTHANVWNSWFINRK